MGLGICADCYVGNRELQELHRLRMGGSAELPIDIRRRLDRQKKPSSSRREEIISDKSNEFVDAETPSVNDTAGGNLRKEVANMKLLTTREFSTATEIPVGTLNRWAAEEKLIPVERGNNSNPSLYSEEQIPNAIRLRKPSKRKDNAESLFSDAESNIIDKQEETRMTDTATTTASETQNPAQIEQADSEQAAAETSPATALIKAIQSEITADAEPVTLEQRAERIRELNLNRDRFDAAFDIAIGRELTAAQNETPHGKWNNWLQDNFGWTQRTANNYMRVAARFGDGKLENVFQFQRSQLQAMLALPVGDEQAFIDAQAEAGKPVESQSAREVQKSVKKWNERRKPKTPPADNSATVTPETNSDDSPVNDNSASTIDNDEHENSGGDDSAVTNGTDIAIGSNVRVIVTEDDEQNEDSPYRLGDEAQNIINEIRDWFFNVAPQQRPVAVVYLRDARDDLSKKIPPASTGRKD